MKKVARENWFLVLPMFQMSFHKKISQGSNTQKSKGKSLVPSCCLSTGVCLLQKCNFHHKIHHLIFFINNNKKIHHLILH